MRAPAYPLASQMKFGAAAQATSRTCFALNRQVSVGLAPAGRVAGWPASVLEMIATVASDRSALVRRARWVVVRTSTGLSSVPVAATTKLRGTVIETSKSPYSRQNSPWPRYCSVFQPRTSSYTATRGYHCAISYSQPGKPLPPHPVGAVLGDFEAVA